MFSDTRKSATAIKTFRLNTIRRLPTNHALSYAKSRVRHGEGTIRVLSATGEVTQTIPFNERAG